MRVIARVEQTFGALACLGKVDVLQVALVASVHGAAPRFMSNIAGWRETGEEMAGNGGVFIERHQLMETYNIKEHRASTRSR